MKESNDDNQITIANDDGCELELPEKEADEE